MRRVVLALILCLAGIAPAFSQGPSASRLQSALARACARPPGRGTEISIAVAPRDGGRLLFGRNAGIPLSIASVSKLFSTATALQDLGRDYQFRTTVYRSGTIVDGVLRGNLLVVGGGDPNLSGRFYDRDIYAVFDRWADGLRQAGITRVTGDLILNNGFFDDQYRNPGWPPGQEARWYQAPISALSYNDNCVAVMVGPGPRPGTRARVSFAPETDYLRVISSARTVSARRRARLAVARRFGSQVITVAGIVPARRGDWSAVVAIDDPPAYFGSALRERLADDGIVVDGETIVSDVRPDATWALLATTTSDLLPSIAVANKRSQSFYAEQVFKTLAAVKLGRGTWPGALSLERQFLTSLHLDPARYPLHDGCGLDRDNQVAAEDVVRFLQAMAGTPIAADWTSTLAVSGQADGSLRHRLRDRRAAGRVHAKTGSLDGVNSLAGYATAASGRTYAFAIILNGKRVDDGNGHVYEDRIVRALLANG